MTLIKTFLLFAMAVTFVQGASADGTAESEVDCGDEVVQTCQELKAMWMD